MAITNGPYGIGVESDMSTKHAVMAGIAAGLTAYVIGTLATGIVVSWGRLLKTGCQIFLFWTGIGVALVGFIGLRFYTRVPGATVWRKTVTLTAFGGFPVFVTGQLIPWTRSITHGFGFVPESLGLPVNLFSHAVTALLSLLVFMYVYRELQRGVAGESSSTAAA